MGCKANHAAGGGMTEEPRYVDDPFGDDAPDLSTSGIEHLHIVEKAQKICRRPVNPFHSPAEKNKWKKIDKQYDKGMISMEWIEHMFGWAKEKNRKRTVIIMSALASAILNKARMTDFNTGQAEEMGLAIKDERDLAEDGF
jgi:hypothetical protein